MIKKAMMTGLGMGLLGLGGIVSADEVETTQNYTVVSGDTVSKIAVKFNTTIEKIDELNNLKDVDVISVGQVLKVPTLTTNTNTNYVSVAPTVTTTQTQTQKPVQNTYTTTQNTTQVQQSVQTSVQQPIVKQTPVVKQTKPVKQQTQVESVQSSGGSVKDRVIRTAMSQGVSRSTAESMWTNIVMPESGGNPNAVNPAGYEGLYQASSSYGWGRGSVESQTVAGIKYMKERYSSVEGAISYRQGHGSY